MPRYTESDNLKCEAYSLSPDVPCGKPIFLVDDKPLGDSGHHLCLDCHLVQAFTAGTGVAIGKLLKQDSTIIVATLPASLREFVRRTQENSDRVLNRHLN